MDYISHIPAFPLNAYIDDLYYLEGHPPYPRLKVPPLPSLHLMINFSPAFQIYALDQTIPFATCTESCWIGMWSKYWIVDWPRPVQFYGVHFKPAGMYPFLRLPLSELHNYDLSHLHKNFVEFTGLNPTDYLRLHRRFQVENPNHCLSVGPLPID